MSECMSYENQVKPSREQQKKKKKIEVETDLKNRRNGSNL